MKTPSKYKHKRTEYEVQLIETNSQNAQYVGLNTTATFPRWVIENSNDWEKIVPSIGDNEPAFSMNEIKAVLRSVNNHPTNVIGTQSDIIQRLRKLKQ